LTHHRCRVASSAVTLLAALYAFYLEHQYWGDLDSAVEDGRVWMACACGAVISRVLELVA